MRTKQVLIASLALAVAGSVFASGWRSSDPVEFSSTFRISNPETLVILNVVLSSDARTLKEMTVSYANTSIEVPGRIFSEVYDPDLGRTGFIFCCEGIGASKLDISKDHPNLQLILPYYGEPESQNEPQENLPESPQFTLVVEFSKGKVVKHYTDSALGEL